MRNRKRNYLQLPLVLLSFIGLIYLIIFINPDHKFDLLSLKISAVILFFILLFIFFQNLFALILKNQRRGLLVGLFLLGIALLIFYNFTHPFFIIMLFALFGIIELLFSRR